VKPIRLAGQRERRETKIVYSAKIVKKIIFPQSAGAQGVSGLPQGRSSIDVSRRSI